MSDPTSSPRAPAPARQPLPSPQFRRLVAVLLLLVGVTCWLSFGAANGLSRLSLAVALVVLAVSLIPAVRRAAGAALDFLREPSPRTANWSAVGVGVAAAILLYAFAAGQGRPFVPTYHDEHVNLIQMHMLARGRLWMPPHPLADFFETFYVFVKPVYAAIYFPGASLLYTPTVWLHLPYWLMPLLVAGAVVGMTCRVVTELVDGVAGLLAALLLLSSRTFRLVSIMLLNHPVMLLAELLSIWAWLRWRGRQQYGWALALGALLGWAAITRPLDALCLALPLVAGVLWDLRRRTVVRRLATFGLIGAGMIPLLSIQLIANYGITGHLFESAVARYLAESHFSLGLAPVDPAGAPPANLLQKKVFYEDFLVPFLESHTVETILPAFYTFRIPTILEVDLPATVLVIMLPVGLLALTDLPRVLVWAILPVFLPTYAVFPAFLPHYALLVSLPISLSLILGIQAVAGTWRGQRQFIATVLTLLVTSFAVTALPGVGANDQYGHWPVMFAVHTLLPRAIQAPAIVLFPFHPGDNPHEEPVYNTDVAWPDDAPIIRVQDLGMARNRELAQYYARTQPDRNVYLFDRRDYSLLALGKPRDFLARLTSELASKAPARPAP